MKYLFIDTNIFIQCCLLELEGDDSNSIKKLHKLLENKKIILLLPEVVRLEFYRRLDIKLNDLKNKIGFYKKQINKDNNIDIKIKKEIINKLELVIEDREENASKVKKEMEKVFLLNSTIKEGLEITPTILSNSYKYFLTKKKPYKEDDKFENQIQPDCIIVETLCNYFKNIKDYEFYFCSLNKTDFAENESVNNKKPKIHPDILDKFSHIKYYENLFELLNEKFKADYPRKAIKKLKEKEAESHRISELSSLTSTTISYSPSATTNVYPLDYTNTSSSISKSLNYGIDSSELLNPTSDIASSTTLSGIYNNSIKKKCERCGKEYKSEPWMMNTIYSNLCENCKGTGIHFYNVYDKE